MSNKQASKKSKKLLFMIVASAAILAITLATFLVTRPEERNYHEAESYIGLSETEATQKAQDVGYEVRVVERDGQPLGQDMDLKDDRINFSISNGEIEEAEIY